jgi:serine phosphatase RsbU (regulator of sigma subunit)
VGGDTFDFSLDHNTLHVSVTDAMGHTVESALLATLVVGALRNTGRRGASLVEQAHNAHEALLAYTGSEVGFVTGQLVRIDLVAQTARVLNAGHPRPFRLRRGRVEEIELTAQEPFGLLEGASWSEQELPLEAGDRLLFLTDGMLERNAESLDIPGADAGQRAPTRGDPVPPTQSSTPSAANSSTTPPPCAWTGTAARRATA